MPNWSYLPRLALPFVSLAIGACTGTIPGPDEPEAGGIGARPGGTGPGPGGVGRGTTGEPSGRDDGSGGTNPFNPTAPPKPIPPGTFGFACADGESGESRTLRRLSRDELREHLMSALTGTSLQSTARTRMDAALSAFPEDTGTDTLNAEEKLETSDGHVQALVGIAESLGTTVDALPAADITLLSSGKCATLTGSGLDACAKGIADELGLRLYRRPLIDAEVAKLKEHLSGIGVTTAAQAVATAFTQLLLQPASLLHLEDGGQVQAGGRAVKITPFEAVNRIHFGLLGAPAPVAVLKKVRDGGWTRQLAEQRIDEILASDAFKSRAAEFFDGWLGIGRNVDLSALPPKMMTGLASKDLPNEAYEEIRAFLLETVFAGRGNVSDLFQSNKVHHLGPNLAKIYGLATTAKGPLNPPLTVDAQKYGGLLGRVAMNLHVESQTSPIARGVRVKRRLLCEDIHPPPNLDLDGGASIEIDDPNKYSNRFLTENKTKPAFCQACHVSIDGIGFSLDFLDSLGRHRTEEIRYDAKGNVVNTFALSTDIDVEVLQGKKVKSSGPRALSVEITDTEKGSACFVSQWQSFTAQSDKYSGESCLKRYLHDKVRSGGPGILEMFRQSARAEIDVLKNLGRP